MTRAAARWPTCAVNYLVSLAAAALCVVRVRVRVRVHLPPPASAPYLRVLLRYGLSDVAWALYRLAYEKQQTKRLLLGYSLSLSLSLSLCLSLSGTTVVVLDSSVLPPRSVIYYRQTPRDWCIINTSVTVTHIEASRTRCTYIKAGPIGARSRVRIYMGVYMHIHIYIYTCTHYALDTPERHCHASTCLCTYMYGCIYTYTYIHVHTMRWTSCAYRQHNLRAAARSRGASASAA